MSEQPYIKIYFNQLFVVFILLLGHGYGAAQSFNLSKTVDNTTPNVGEPFNYIIDASCNSSTQDCESAVITDVIPPQLEFLNFSDPLPDGVRDAIYDQSTNTATITFDATSCTSCNPDGINTDNDDFSQGSSIQLALQVRFPSGTFTGTTAQNTVCGTSNNAGNPCDSSREVTAINGRNPESGCSQLYAEITMQNPVSPGIDMFIRNRVGNLGTSTIQNYQISTRIPTEMDFAYIQAPNWPGVNQNINLEYQRSDQSGTWLSWTSINVSTNGNDIYQKSSLGLPAGVEVIAVRMLFGDLSGDGSWNPYSNLAGNWESSFRLYGIVRNSVTEGSIINACSDYSGTVSGSNCNERACNSTTVGTPGPVIAGGKQILDLDGEFLQVFSPGDKYLVSLDFASDEINDQDVLGGVMVDVLPPGMTYVPDSYYIDRGHDNIQNQVPVIQIENLVDGRQLIRFVWDDSFGNEFTLSPKGFWTGFSLRFEVQISSGIATGPYSNQYYYTATGSNHACENNQEQDTNNYLGGYGFDSDVCHDSAEFEVIRPPSSAGLESLKEVRGSRNANYSRYPNYGTTVPGGVNDYRLSLTNPNATPINDLVVIDIFPTTGDTEILNTSIPRYSEWSPNLLGPIDVTGNTTIYYTTVTNPCRDEVAPPSASLPFPTGCTDAGWSTTPPDDITTVTGFKLDLRNNRLNQGQTFELEWEMRAPVNAPTNGEIAWNSFAWSGANATSGNPLLPAEPIKVGIESYPGSVPFHGDFVWDDLDGNGKQDPGEPGINGVTVTLYQDNGDGVANPTDDTPYMTTVSANGGLYLFSDFPLGNYFVEFSNLPSGYNPTHTNVGNDNTIDSDGLVTTVTTFGSTTDDRTCDLGLYFGEPPPLTPLECELIDIDDSNCQNNNAVATINAVGGTPPYQYNIGNGNQSSGVFSNLSGGEYTITVTDASNDQSVCGFYIDCAEPCTSNIYTELVSSCFNFGGYQGAYAANDAIVGFRENLTNNPTTNSLQQFTHYATHEQVGTVYGVALGRDSKTIYTSAFMKRHAGFGPGGTGAIYAIDQEQNTPPVLLADLNSIYGANTAGINTHDFDESDTCPGGSNFSCWFNDVDTWDAVGRSSLGDLDISDDQRFLYVMNLADRHVYQIDVQNPTVPQTRYPFPLDQLTDSEVTLKPLDPQIDIRPFALKYRGDKLYVGAVDTEESRTACCFEGGSVIYVYSLDLATGDWQLELEADVQKGADSGTYYIAKWYTGFQDDYRDGNKMILADIEFDGPDMILGLRDMTGDLFGNNAGKPIAGDSQTVFYDNKVGDLVRFDYDDSTGGYILESNGTSGNTTTGGTFSGYGWPPDSSPRGSYYFGDFQSLAHPQTSLGGLWVNPYEDRAYSTVFNPLDVFSTGVKAFDNSFGATAEAYVLLANTDNSANFGKTNGLGDIEGFIICESCCTNIYMNGYIRSNRTWDSDNEE